VAARIAFARTMARKYLKKHGVLQPPVPVEFMLFTEEIRVEKVLYPDATAGEAWWEEGTGHIAVSRDLPPGRLRFTLAHEFAHLALRHHDRRFGDLSDIERRLRDPDELEWDPVDPVEVEANQFAAELLMPPAFFLRDRRRSGIRRLAALYEVSEEAVRWRLAGLT
jgi:Zn-dependent peptidase ImmA (M78 family)